MTTILRRRVLPNLTPQQWDGEKSTQQPRTNYLQNVDDTIQRPINNRLTAASTGTNVNCNGAVQSSGIGVGTLQPKRYAEFTVKACVTFEINSVGPAYVYVYRTTGAIPANGAAPNAGDVAVGGGSFTGGAMTSGVNESGSLSFLDTGLSVSQTYSYYLAVKGSNGNTLTLASGSQVLVMERP